MAARKALPDPCEKCGKARKEHPARGCPKPATTDPAWAAAAAASAEREARELAEVMPEPEPAKALRATADGAPAFDIDTIDREAARLGPGAFGLFRWVDERCVVAELTPTSPWWLYSLGGFYASGKRWGIWQVGRGAGKSTTLERVAAADALLTHRFVPPGQRWEYPFVSVGPEDANRRIRGLEAIYARALKLEVKAALSPRPHIDMDDARANEIRLASVAGTIGNLSGLNAIGLIIDEAAKLHDKSTNANPLSEIVASVIGAFRGRPNIRAIICSSAWQRSGAHFEMVEAGDTETNYIARLGDLFLPDAVEGLHAVAAWEEAGDASTLRPPDPVAAATIRAHAATLTAQSPAIPTWVANPMYGPTPAAAAIATRKEVQALPPRVLDGLPRHVVWLREIASVPVSGEIGGVDYSAQCLLAAEIGEALARARGGITKPPSRMVQAHPLAGPGDARYAGGPRASAARQTWRERRVF